MAFDRTSLGWAALNVTVNGKPATMKVANMTDAQIIAALARPDNAGALAAGWTRDAKGQIIKTPVAAPPRAPVVPPPVPAPVTAPPPASTPPPTAVTPAPGVGAPPPAGTPAPTGTAGAFDRTAIRKGVTHLTTYRTIGGVTTPQTQAIAGMTDAELKAALRLPINRSVLAPGWTITGGNIVRSSPTSTTSTTPKPDTPVTPSPTQGGPGAVSPAPTNPGPATNPAVTATGAPAWVPPMVGFGGLNADPVTGKIDWSKIIAQAKEISAVDPTYAQDLSNNMFSAMQAISLPQSEIQSLTTMDPTTGKTLYQSMFDSAMQKFGQNTSSAMGSAAARGIGSSGMVNSTIATNAADNAKQVADYGKTYGNQRISDLLKQMTGTLQTQDTNNLSSYYSALSRAQQGIPTIPKVGS
jgi:hypothetical protein